VQAAPGDFALSNALLGRRARILRLRHAPPQLCALRAARLRQLLCDRQGLFCECQLLRKAVVDFSLWQHHLVYKLCAALYRNLRGACRQEW
jgi:hypothetical protein